MRRRMSARQLVGWRAYQEVEAFGPRGDNLYAAIPAKAAYDLAGAKKADGEPLGYEDFLLRPAPPKPPPKPRDWRTNLSIAKVIALAWNREEARRQGILGKAAGAAGALGKRLRGKRGG